MSKQNRRDFLKTSLAGTTGAIIAGSGVNKAFAKKSGGWYPGAKANENIDNLRVVYAEDSSMTTGDWSSNFSTCNGRVDDDKVITNINTMACALANNADSEAAWKTIFQKPDSKEWDQVNAAIKVNGLGSVHPSWATLEALCEGLKTAGVSASNITVFDACSGCTSLYNGNLPTDVNCTNGSSFPVNIPNWGTATNVIQNADIIVNCAVCKGHSSGVGRFTMTMKNHLGTAKPHHASSPSQLVTINKSEAIFGTPGTGVPAKSQLAFIDCLWTADPGPSNGADRTTNILVMGVLNAAVDYCTAHKVRDEICDYSISESNTKSLLTAFEDENDVDELLTFDPNTDPQGRGWLDIADWNPVAINPQKKIHNQAGTLVEFSIMGAVATKLTLKKGDILSSLFISDLKGRRIHSMPVKKGQNSVRINWNGRTGNNGKMKPGTYVVTIQGQKTKVSKKFTYK